MSELIEKRDAYNIIKDMVGLVRCDVLMDAYDALKNLPTVKPASQWRSVGEKPRDGQECIVAYLGPTDWIYEHATYHSDLNEALEEDIFIDGTDGFIVDGDIGYARHSFNYWMPIEPPKEGNYGN